MIKFSRLISLFLFFVFELFPQYTALHYEFLANPYGGFAEISEGIKSTATGDDGAENITLPFSFPYMDSNYTTARVSVNGWLELGLGFTGTGSNNQIASITDKPLVCPLWDDLLADDISEITYKTLGAFPARIFVVQWKNIRWRENAQRRKTFQLRLWEIDGTIEFRYGPGSSSGGSGSIGMNNQAGGSGNYISVTPRQPESFIISSTIPCDTISVQTVKNGMMFLFIRDIYRFENPLGVLYQTADSLISGSQNQKILAIIVPDHNAGSLTPGWITGFDFHTSGTTNINDLLNAKLFTTGSSPVFSTGTQLGTTVQNPGGVFTIDGFTDYILLNNVKYYWLTFDISPNAVSGNFVDASCFKIRRDQCCPSIYPDTTLAGTKCVIKNPSPLGMETDPGLNKTIDVQESRNYRLFQNFPNPFNPATTISFEIPERSNVELSVYTIMGEKVATLARATYDAGAHSVEWNASGFPSGIYYYELKAGIFRSIKKLSLIK